MDVILTDYKLTDIFGRDIASFVEAGGRLVGSNLESSQMAEYYQYELERMLADISSSGRFRLEEVKRPAEQLWNFVTASGSLIQIPASGQVVLVNGQPLTTSEVSLLGSDLASGLAEARFDGSSDLVSSCVIECGPSSTNLPGEWERLQARFPEHVTVYSKDGVDHLRITCASKYLLQWLDRLSQLAIVPQCVTPLT